MKSQAAVANVSVKQKVDGENKRVVLAGFSAI